MVLPFRTLTDIKQDLNGVGLGEDWDCEKLMSATWSWSKWRQVTASQHKAVHVQFPGKQSSS